MRLAAMPLRNGSTEGYPCLRKGCACAFAVFARCFTCTKDVLAAKRIASGLAAAGVGVLRFDFTGLGSSEEEFANTNFSSNVEDLVRAAAYLRDKYAAPSVLICHSLGGAAVLAAAQDVPEARAVVTIGAPADIAHVPMVTPLRGDLILLRAAIQQRPACTFVTGLSGGCLRPETFASARATGFTVPRIQGQTRSQDGDAKPPISTAVTA
jgi:pimeloyl-ACP methyl ester carboxylesterase